MLKKSHLSRSGSSNIRKRDFELNTGSKLYSKADKELLNISVNLVQFIPLLPNEDFSLQYAQAFMEALELHKSVPKPIKTHLRAFSSGLFIENGSWWPEDGKSQFIAYSQIRKYITFRSRLQVLLLGIIRYDEKQKGFMFITTRNASDTKQLCAIIEGGENQFLIQSPVSPIYSNEPKNQPDPIATTSNKFVQHEMIPENYNTQEKVSVQEAVRTAQENYPSSSRLNTPILNRRELTPEQQLSAQKLKPDGTHYQSPVLGFPITSLTPRSASPVKTKVQSSLKPVTSEKKQDRVQRVYNFDSDLSPDFRRRVGTTGHPDESPWEIDIKYITYDPAVGNVIDESGPVYMYTAHQIIPHYKCIYGTCGGSSDEEESPKKDDKVSNTTLQ